MLSKAARLRKNVESPAAAGRRVFETQSDCLLQCAGQPTVRAQRRETIRMNKTALIAALAVSFALAACGKQEKAETPGTPALAPAEVAEMERREQEQAIADLVPGTDLTSRQSGFDLYAGKCLGCHGDAGQGAGANPRLDGLRRADVAARLADYRAGKAAGPNAAAMAAAARDLSDENIEALAGYVGG